MEATFLKQLESEYTELLETGKIPLLEEVKKHVPRRFQSRLPIYFVGNIRSKFVVITFNSSKEYITDGKQPSNFKSYQTKLQNLGSLFYECYSDRVPPAKYHSDLREFHFVKPFNTIWFEREPQHKKLQKMIDELLQLDLFPYPSPDLSEKDLLNSSLLFKPFVARILSGVVAAPRKYAVFLGSFFNGVLSDYTESSDRFTFSVVSDENTPKSAEVSFTRVVLNYEGTKIVAGVADSFYNEKLNLSMLERYGEEAAKIINRGVLLAHPIWGS